MLTILDEHYNNVKALDALNQKLFQLRMEDKETVLDWSVHLSRHFQVLAASFPDCFPPDRLAELKRDHFYGGLPKHLKAMVAYLKVGPAVNDLFQLSKGCSRSGVGRFHEAVQESKDSDD